MSKDVLKFSVMLALAAVIWLPNMASADYVQVWSENGQYGPTNAQQTWDKAEAFLVSGGTWTDPGLTVALTGWTATLINPPYALATGPAFNSSLQGIFSFTTYATDRTATDPFVFDWILWHGTTIVGFDRLTWTPATGGGWTLTGSQISAADFYAQSSPRKPLPAPLPPSLCSWAADCWELVLLHRRKRSRPRTYPSETEGPRRVADEALIVAVIAPEPIIPEILPASSSPSSAFHPVLSGLTTNAGRSGGPPGCAPSPSLTASAGAFSGRSCP